MTSEEAIAVLEDRQTCRECVHSLNNSEEFECGCDECDNAFGIAYDALKKQIPKKPQQASQPCFYWCPNCELAIKKRIESSIKIINNCPFCGQAIDWSDT